MQEQRVYARDLKFTVPTEFNQGAKEEESKEAEVEKQEESKEVKGEEKNNDDKKEKKNKEKKHNDLKEKKNNDLKENKRNQKIDENTGNDEASNQYIPSAATEQVQIEEQKIEAENKIQENSEENSEENKETEVKPEVTTNQENKIELTDAKEAAQIETKKPEMPQKSQQTIEVQSKLSFTLNVQFFSKFIPIFRINFHLTQQRANFENQKHLFKNNFKIFNFILATSKCC